jgi:hypothetical protein
MISKQATKSKPNARKEMARARNSEIYSSRGKGHAKTREGRRASYGLARASTGLSSYSNPSGPELACISQSRPVEALSPRAEAGGPRQKRLRKLMAIVAPDGSVMMVPENLMGPS